MTTGLNDLVADLIKRHRRFLYLSRDDLAAKCRARGAPDNFTGAVVGNIERSRRSIGLQEAEIVAQALGLTLVDLVRVAQGPTERRNDRDA